MSRQLRQRTSASAQCSFHVHNKSKRRKGGSRSLAALVALAVLGFFWVCPCKIHGDGGAPLLRDHLPHQCDKGMEYDHYPVHDKCFRHAVVWGTRRSRWRRWWTGPKRGLMLSLKPARGGSPGKFGHHNHPKQGGGSHQQADFLVGSDEPGEEM